MLIGLLVLAAEDATGQPAWATALAILSIFFVGLSFAAYVVELHAIRSQNRGIGAVHIGEAMAALTRTFLEYPELRPFIYDGAEPPADPRERARVDALAELYVDFTALTLNNLQLLPDDQHEGWRAYFRDLGERSPAIRAYYLRNREWYEDHVRDVLDPVCVRDEAQEPPEPVTDHVAAIPEDGASDHSK